MNHKRKPCDFALEGAFNVTGRFKEAPMSVVPAERD